MVNKSVSFWTCQNAPRPQKPFFWDWNMKNLETRFHFENFEKYLKFAHGISVQDESYAFPNELVRFRNEAKPIWEKNSETL